MELGLHALAPPSQVAHGLVTVAPGAQERFLADEGLLGSFILRVQAPDAVDHAGGPRALAPGRRLGAETMEALVGSKVCLEGG